MTAGPTSPTDNSGDVAPTLQFDPETYNIVLQGVTSAGLQMSAVAKGVPTELPPAGILGPLDADWREFHQRYSTEVASSSAALGELGRLLPVICDSFEQADRSSSKLPGLQRFREAHGSVTPPPYGGPFPGPTSPSTVAAPPRSGHFGGGPE
jgi:hypothetical protein